MPKQILFWENAREEIIAWMKIVADTVSVTMWPKWRNVILEKTYWPPLITNDWVTIAREIELEDKFMNMWAELVKDAADRTNTIAWDWTTTSTILIYWLAKEWLSHIKSWINSVELKNWMKEASIFVIEELWKNSATISSRDEVEQVATISAQDYEVWEIIAEAMAQVGNNGVISVKEWQTFWLEVEITQWMEFDGWYMSPYMVSNPEKMTSEAKDSYILITDKKISNMNDILPILEKLIQEWTKDLVIMAEDIDGEALTTIVLNKLKWILNILAIKNPWFWENKKELLKDIAILTWANIITGDLWMKLENAKLSDLWSAESIISSQNNTVIIWWKWDREDIESRVAELHIAIENSDSSFVKDKLAERLAKLDWWVAVIKVWAASEVEMKEKKLRIEDALNATRAAVSEWVVAWGWVALLKASKVLDNIDLWSNDRNIWAAIVKKALTYPVMQIATNAWKDSKEILEKITSNDSINYWYDAAKDEFTDMISSWIIDPTKVERVALQEAVSLAWMFLTTESAVVSIKKPEENKQMPSWMWGMPWMWWMPMM